MSAGKIIEVEGITKSYRDAGSSTTKTVLHEVTFSLDRGESMGIIGRNGSGKSTLLKILSGVLKPDSGTAKIYGKSTSILDIGFGLIPDLTGRENIYLVGRMEGFSTAQINTRFDDIVDFTELNDFIHAPVKTYSNGMYLRLAFGIKTLIDPELMIFDEVMSVGDFIFQEKCKQRIKQLQRDGCSIILVSHSWPQILEYSRQCLIIEGGHVSALGRSTEVINKFIDTWEEAKVKTYNAKALTGEKNDRIDQVSVQLSKTKMAMGESLQITIDFEILIDDTYHITLFVSDFNGTIFSDSPSFREIPDIFVSGEGKHTLTCSLPPFFFNVGVFKFGFIIATDSRHYYEKYDCARIEVEHEGWDKEKPWNQDQQYYPLRPRLAWTHSHHETDAI